MSDKTPPSVDCPFCKKKITTFLRPGRATLLCEHCHADVMFHMVLLDEAMPGFVDTIAVKPYRLPRIVS